MIIQTKDLRDACPYHTIDCNCIIVSKTDKWKDKMMNQCKAYYVNKTTEAYGDAFYNASVASPFGVNAVDVTLYIYKDGPCPLYFNSIISCKYKSHTVKGQNYLYHCPAF